MPGEIDYDRARELGALLAANNFGVATGGYEGIMAGVSQGAAEAGGHVIGVTSVQVEQTRGTTTNRWVQTEIKYPTLAERVMHLVINNDGMIVLPGGIGTLSEFALAWSFIQVEEIDLRPLVLLGDMWAKVLDTFIGYEYVLPEHVQLLNIARAPTEAIDFINQNR